MFVTFFQSFDFITSLPGFLFVLIILGTVAGLILSLRWQIREVPRLPRIIIVSLRCLIICLVLFCALRPALHVSLGGEGLGHPELRLFVDASPSMALADRRLGPITRFDLLNNMADAIVRDNHGYSSRIVYFSTAELPRPACAASGLTDLTFPLRSCCENNPPRGSLAVVLSDGCHTATNDLNTALAACSAYGGLPVYTAGLSEGDRIPRVAITEISTPQHAWKSAECTLKVSFQAYDCDNAAGSLILLKDESTLASRDIALSNGIQTATFQITPEEPGVHQYRFVVSAPAVPRAQAWCAVAVSRRTFNVLYLEGTTINMHTGETVFNNVPDALTATDDIECDIKLGIDSRRNGITEYPLVDDPKNGYPLTLQGLAQYDVIINSDIEISRFSKRQIDNTARFVEELGGGYVMIGGETAFGRGGWDETRIDRISPVDMGANRYMEGPFYWTFTDEGRQHPILQFADDPAKNDAILDAMPPFHGYNDSVRVKPTAVLLATHATKKNVNGLMAMLAVQEIGRGRCMAFLTDTTWLWGEDFENHWGEPLNAPDARRDKQYYTKFWQNAVRWLGRNSRRHILQTRFITTDKILYSPGQPVSVAYNDPGAFELDPLPEATLQVQNPDGTSRSYPLKADPARELYAATFTLDAVGAVTLAVHRTGIEQQTILPLDSRTDPAELLFCNPDSNLLRSIAEQTGGEFVTAGEALNLPEPAEQTNVQRQLTDIWHDIWDRPWLLILIIGLVTAEWIIRRYNGMA